MKMNSALGFRLRPLAAAIASCVSLTGCGVLFTTGSPGKLDENKVVQYSTEELTAVTYYLPKDVLEVEAQIDSQVISSLEYPKGDESKTPVKKTESPISKLERFDASIVTIADRNKPFLIDANSPGFYKNDSSINVSESGLLESINTKTTGAGGAVVQNVLKLAGTVLPFVSVPRLSRHYRPRRWPMTHRMAELHGAAISRSPTFSDRLSERGSRQIAAPIRIVRSRRRQR
jgi:hypothetical protein